MKLYAYRGLEPNFGDELNHWLMPRVFPQFFDDDADVLFLGIGSTLFNHHPPEVKKIVFGAGFGGYTAAPKLDDKWTVYCVRGPKTAEALGLGQEFVAGDAAILINRYRPARRSKASKVSFMPHFQSVHRGQWARACRLAGITFIDPRQDVEVVLEQIEDSKLIIAEAMHGAIVADALRVPWVAVLPFHPSHRIKWLDWAGALNMTVRFRYLAPSSSSEAILLVQTIFGRRFKRLKGLRKRLQLLDPIFVLAAAFSLVIVAHCRPKLSSDSALETSLDRLSDCARRILERHSLSPSNSR